MTQLKMRRDKIVKEYVVTFLNLDANKVGCDCFTENSEEEARHSFRECYRHSRYKILSTVPTGR